jgi:hypothetical protein
MEGIAIPLAASASRTAPRNAGVRGDPCCRRLPLGDCHGVPLDFGSGYPPVQSSESTLN